MPAEVVGARDKDAPMSTAPQSALYGQLHHGRRSAGGGTKKRYKDQIKNALKKCKIRLEDLENGAADRTIWQKLCRDGVHMLEMERTRQHKQARRNTAMTMIKSVLVHCFHY